MFKISKVPERKNTYVITLINPLKKVSYPFKDLSFQPDSVVYTDSKLLWNAFRFSKFKIKNSKIDLDSEELVNEIPKDICEYANTVIKTIKV